MSSSFAATYAARVKRAVAGVRGYHALLSKLRWHTVRALAPRRLVRSRGLLFTLSCGNWITQYRWQTYNEKEPETLDWIDRRVRDGEMVFDIGANIGVYALYAALRHPRSRVIAFEPEYANLHLLRDNVIENGLQDRVEVYALALSNHTGVSWLHLQDLAPGSALHTESRSALARTLTGHPVVWREGIWTVRLDAFCEATGILPHHIKLDVDGTELSVLEGAQRTLASLALRSVILELSANQQVRQACERLLGEAGLHRVWHDPRGHSPNEIWERDSR
jgi:FkbM family methyltransferase